MSESTKKTATIQTEGSAPERSKESRTYGKFLYDNEAQRKRRKTWLTVGLVAATAVMLAFVHYEQMTYIPGIIFTSGIAAMFGAGMR